MAKVKDKSCEECPNVLKRGKRFCSQKCYSVNRAAHDYGGRFKKGHKPMCGFKIGQPAWNSGKKFVHSGSFKVGHADLVPIESRASQSEKIKGEKNNFWQGGLTTPERLRFHCARYRARKYGNGGKHTQKEWEELKTKHNSACVGCKRSNLKLTQDHILPLSKGGTDNIKNIQPLCQSCNSKKRDKYIAYV